MMQATEFSATVADPIVRSGIYRSLALGFKYPSPESYELYQSGRFMTELMERIAALSHLFGLAAGKEDVVARAGRELEGLEFRDFEVKYVETFDVGFPKPPCPPYEGLYREGDRAAVLLEVSEFYKHFGLQMSRGEGKGELPDHLCAELEFLHFLTFKEDQARQMNDAELLDGYLLAQKDFQQRHLLQWIASFREKVRDLGSVPFYGELAGLAAEFVAADADWVASELERQRQPR